MIELPEGCFSTTEHALIHIWSALEVEGDYEQVRHDLYIASAILENILEDET